MDREDDQLTFDDLIRQTAKEIAREEARHALYVGNLRDSDRIEQVKRESREHTDEIRKALGAIMSLEPLERFAIVQLARELAKYAEKKRIKRRIRKLMTIAKRES